MNNTPAICRGDNHRNQDAVECVSIRVRMIPGPLSFGILSKLEDCHFDKKGNLWTTCAKRIV